MAFDRGKNKTTMKAYHTSPFFSAQWVNNVSLLFLLFSTLFAQGQSWQWGNSGGADDNVNPPGPEKVTSMCTASDGSTYMAAQVGRIDLRIAGIPKETYSSVGLNDWIVAGFSCGGDYKWSKVLGGYLGAQRAIVGSDAEGSVYTACHITRTPPNVSPPPHFDSDVILGSSAVDVNTFKQTIYLIKYDANGNYLWSTTPQAADISRSTGSQASVFDLQVDSQGNSYMLCLLTPSIYGGAYVVTAKGFHIVKYDSQGNFTGAFALDMNVNAAPYNFKMKRDHANGRIYLGGENDVSIATGLSFGGQPVTHSKFLAAFDATGDLIWEKENTITSIPGDGGVSYGVTVDSDSNVYFIGATGWLSGNISVPDSFNGIPFVNNGTPPWPFIVKLDPAGNTLWQTNGTRSNLVAVAVNGDEVAVTAGASQMVWQGINFSMPASGQPYIARFQKSNGEIIGIERLTTTSNDSGTTLTADPQGNYYLGGRFGGSLTAGADTVTSNGGISDFFIAKFGTDNCNLATESFNNEKVEVYPNPVREQLYLANPKGQGFRLFNSLGLEVLSGTFTQDGAINVESLASGIYLMQVSQDGQSGWVKVVKL
jgi:hypothetical protein